MKFANLKMPGEIPVMILPQTVLFPHALLPLHIFEEKYRQMLAWSLEHARVFAVAPVLSHPDYLREPSDIPEIIGVGLIRACVGKEDGTSDLILQGLGRVRITHSLQDEPFRMMAIADYPTFNHAPEKVSKTANELILQSTALAQAGLRMPAQLTQYLELVKDPEIIGDLLAAAFVQNCSLRQQILAEPNLRVRLEMILVEMKSLTALGGT